MSTSSLIRQVMVAYTTFMLNFNNTKSVSEFTNANGITSIDEMTLDNGKKYLLANNGMSLKASDTALAALKSGTTQSIRISECTEDDSVESFFMLHVSNSLGRVTHTFTF